MRTVVKLLLAGLLFVVFLSFSPNSNILVNEDDIKTIKIGNQEWMVKNLNVSNFNNGDPIPEVKDKKEWKAASKNGQPAWCYYENLADNGIKYGKLYNWYAVSDPRGIAPEGFHIPTDKEWIELIKFLGGETVAGNKLKLYGEWGADDKGRTIGGFSALPGGFRDDSGNFWNIGASAGFHCSNANDKKSGINVHINAQIPDANIAGYGLGFGFSIRCIKNK